ncbi:MAG: hypothetical protein DHS20C11_08640 [Lysobacteraceae bacterium]|nr:MAG: hypothetical protein DHS20C11_08640 [Xanthomonadaceae bacterium]
MFYRLSTRAFALLVSVATLATLLPLAANAESDKTPDAQDAMTREQRRALPLSEKLRISRPAPNKAPAGFVPIPGVPDILQSIDHQGVIRNELQDGVDPTVPLRADELVPFGLEIAAAQAGVAAVKSASPPSILRNTHSFPFTTIAKMLMDFDGYLYNCSATLVNRYFLLTAAHCIYNHDPNQDDDTSDAQWADQVWVFPGQTDYIVVDGFIERPFGEANWSELYAYTGWTQQADIEFDQAFVRIDRPLGEHAGWMGYETNTTTSSLNFSGYPVQAPYVPSDSIVQYWGYDPDNVTGYSTNRIHLNAFVYGGHSGGPAWRYDGSQRRLQGMNSTSNRVGSATAARITNQVFDDLQAEIDEPRTETLRPDLAEWTRWTAYPTKTLYTLLAQPGESIAFDYNIGNHGFADTGTIVVDFYLSPVPDFSFPPGASDVFIGQTQLSNLAENHWYLPFESIDLPAGLGGGNWYVSWFAYSSNTEYSSYTSTRCSPFCNNTASIETQPLRVANPWEQPDLIIDLFDIQSSDLQHDELYSIDLAFANDGNFHARTSWGGVYLSDDNHCSSSQDISLSIFQTTALDPLVTTNTNVTLLIPDHVPVGSAWLCVIADVFDDVQESDEQNNTAIVSVNVLPSDLIFMGSFGDLL